MNAPVLYFDLGNTNIKITLGKGKTLNRGVVIPTHSLETPDSIGLKLVDICRFFEVDPGEIKAWVISSVVPPLDSVLARACDRFFSCPCLFAGRDIPFSIRNLYSRPSEVGADRLATACGSRVLFDAPLIISIDFGTATTFDCVKGDAYLGGLICPGVLSSTKALGSSTAKLPQIDLSLKNTRLEVGKSTVQSLRQGVIHGFACMVEGLCIRLAKSLDHPDPLVVATGGHAATLQPVCTTIDHIVPDLLVRGLQHIYHSHIH